MVSSYEWQFRTKILTLESRIPRERKLINFSNATRFARCDRSTCETNLWYSTNGIRHSRGFVREIDYVRTMSKRIESTLHCVPIRYDRSMAFFLFLLPPSLSLSLSLFLSLSLSFWRIEATVDDIAVGNLKRDELRNQDSHLTLCRRIRNGIVKLVQSGDRLYHRCCSRERRCTYICT